jgi:hypothetical protein
MSDMSIGILNPGEQLVGAQNQRLYSPSGQYFLVMQSDGNLVVYAVGQGDTGQNSNKPIWASHTNGKGGAVAKMQGDGNFVVYTASNQPIWASNTNGKANSFVRMQDDGNLVIYTASWASNTKQ